MGMKNQVAPSSPESDTPDLQAQEELRNWLERRLEILGIRNSHTHSQLVLNFLRSPFSVPSNIPEQALGIPGSSGGDGNLPERDKIRHDNEQILVDILMNLCDQLYPVNMLIDELSLRIRRTLQNYKQNESENNVEASAGASAIYIPSSIELIDNSFRQENRNNFDIKVIRNKINSNITENSIAKNQKNIEQFIHKQAILRNTEIVFIPPTANMDQMNLHVNEPIDESNTDFRQLCRKLFDKKVRAIWHTMPNSLNNFLHSTWASSVWPLGELHNPVIDKFLETKRKIGSISRYWSNDIINDNDEVIDELRQFFDAYRQCAPENERKSFQNSFTLNEPRNRNGYNIWSNVAAENDHSWDTFLNATASNLPRYEENLPAFLPSWLLKACGIISNVKVEPEDLLTSSRTHFRPIREYEKWSDGTTFPIDSSIETITFSRSESGKFYRPGSDTPYMKFPHRTATSSFMMHIPIRQNNKMVQTDPQNDSEDEEMRHFLQASSNFEILNSESNSETSTFEKLDSEKSESKKSEKSDSSNSDTPDSEEANSEISDSGDSNWGTPVRRISNLVDDLIDNSNSNCQERDEIHMPLDHEIENEFLNIIMQNIENDNLVIDESDNIHIRRKCWRQLKFEYNLEDHDGFSQAFRNISESAMNSTALEENGIQQNDRDSFDSEFPPLPGLDRFTLCRLKRVVPVHLTRERKYSGVFVMKHRFACT